MCAWTQGPSASPKCFNLISGCIVVWCIAVITLLRFQSDSKRWPVSLRAPSGMWNESEVQSFSGYGRSMNKMDKMFENRQRDEELSIRELLPLIRQVRP